MPRKSNASAVAEPAEPTETPEVSEVAEEETSAPKSASREPKDDTLSVEDLNLPKSIVQRLAKGMLPPNTQIQKDALLAMSKSATVFVSYLTSCAAETAARSGKKTVMPADVFAAMHDLEFSFMLPRLEAEVTKFTSIQADKRNTYRKKVREVKKAQKEGGPADGTDVVGGAEEHLGEGVGGDGERAAKRAKIDGEGEGGGSDGEEGGEGDETVDVEDEEVEDDEIEEEEEGGEGEGEGEGLQEDALEEKEDKEDDEEMEDGDESD